MGCYKNTYPTSECDANRCPHLNACRTHQKEIRAQNKYFTEKWRKFRRELIKKRGSKCQECTSETNLQVHHIKRATIAPNLFYVESNCLVLCKLCHQELHDEAQTRFEEHDYEGDDEELCDECGINFHPSRFETCYKCHTDSGWFM